MNDQVLAIVIAALVSAGANIIIKFLEKKQTKPQEEKIEAETSEITNTTLRRTLEETRNHVIYLEERLRIKRQELDSICKELEACKEKLKEEN